MADKHTVSPHDHASTVELERAAAMLKAAGDPERLRLLECLREGEACVSGLAEHLDQAVTTTSNARVFDIGTGCARCCCRAFIRVAKFNCVAVTIRFHICGARPESLPTPTCLGAVAPLLP